MFGHKRQDEKLRTLEQELWEAEEETDEEEYEEDEFEEDWNEEDEDPDEEYWDDEDEDACLEYDLSEEEELENSFFGQKNSRYSRGNPKKFTDRDFFDDDGFADEDVLYRRDYKKAKRKKRRKAFGMILLAILELIILGTLILWFMSWM